MSDCERPRFRRTVAAPPLALLLGTLCLAGCSADAVRPANQAPVLVSLTAEPETVIEGQTIRLTAKVADPDGDRLTFEWLPVLGYVTGSGHEVTYSTTGCCLGGNAVQLTVRDGRGGEVVAVANVTVR